MRAECVLGAEELKAFLKSLNVLVDEAKIRFEEGGMTARAVDASNVALVSAVVAADSAEEYEREGDLVVGVDVKRLLDVVKRIKKNESVRFVVKEDEIAIVSGKLSYSIMAIDPRAVRKEPNVPSPNYPVRAVLPADDLKRALSLAEKVSDEVVLEFDGEFFSVIGSGDFETVTTRFEAKDLIEFEPGFERATYNVEYLLDFLKVADGCVAEIRIKTDFPCQLTLKTDGGLRIDYFLAPRIAAD